MITKQCFRCEKWKAITSFYKHPLTKDGRLGKCKKCTQKDVQDRYNDPNSIDKIKEYERKRFHNPDRKKKVLAYQRKRRLTYKGKEKARKAIHNAVKEGKVVRKNCEICGDIKTQAHHTDYRKYYDVKWLCFKHHRLEHKKNG